MRAPGVAVMVLALASGVAQAQDPIFTHQGRLLDASGAPLQGTRPIEFRLYDADTSGSLLWDESHAVALQDGYYSVILGTSTPLGASVTAADALWLEQVVDGAVSGPRQRLGAVPRALRADGVVGGVQIDGGGAARPACDADHRGVVWVSPGTASASDAAHLCSREAGGRYEWVTLWEPFVATGGTVTDLGEYRVHAFTAVGDHVFRVTSGERPVDVLVVGGGGGGGSTWGGGGGAGGLVFVPGYPLSAGVYTVRVGQGGAGIPAPGTSVPGNDGTPSRFAHFQALGGGGGGSVSGNSPRAGGSGGSGSVGTAGGQGLQPDSGTGGYGNPGGPSTSGGAFNEANGGGGGAGAPGNGLGPGGVGLYQVVIGGTTYNFADLFGAYGHQVAGQSWFAGGGVGGCKITSTISVINGGGGGATPNSASPRSGFSGLANTGGGGGGQCTSHNGTGSGGSGIVLVRYRR